MVFCPLPSRKVAGPFYDFRVLSGMSRKPSKRGQRSFVHVKDGVEPAATILDLVQACNTVNDTAEKNIFTDTYNHVLATCVYLMWYCETNGKVWSPN
jgi:hypothetical protein